MTDINTNMINPKKYRCIETIKLTGNKGCVVNRIYDSVGSDCIVIPGWGVLSLNRYSSYFEEITEDKQANRSDENRKAYISPIDILFPRVAYFNNDILVKNGSLFYIKNKDKLAAHYIEGHDTVFIPASIVETWQEYKKPILYTESQIKKISQYYIVKAIGNTRADAFTQWLYQYDRWPKCLEWVSNNEDYDNDDDFQF